MSRSVLYDVGLGEASTRSRSGTSSWLWERPTCKSAAQPIDVNIPASRLPLNHVERIRNRDKKLLDRELAYAQNCNWKHMKCSCIHCEGIPSFRLSTVKHHLTINGRHPLLRSAGQLEDLDSSDEEWEASLSEKPEPTSPNNDLSGRRQLWSLNSGCDTGKPDPTPLEPPEPGTDMDPGTRFKEMLEDLLGAVPDDAKDLNDDDALSDFDPGTTFPNKEVFNDFREYFQPLYEGSKQTVMEFTVLAVNLCVQYRVSNKFADALLSFLGESVLPQPNLVPRNMYFAKKIINTVGLNFVTIHACQNGCVLFRGEYASLDKCPKCDAERYKRIGKSLQAVHKVWYFPLIPRLLRMYKCPSIAALMTWAHEHKSEDGLVRHVADSHQWNLIDSMYPEFAAEPRNVRFGLALDGVNPFGNLSNSHSTWPVMLVNYGLPPWQLTKPFFVMLSILISGPQSVTKENMDVYIQPLVEELDLLWREGVDAYDCLGRYGSHKFRLKAMLFCTVNDYPALGYISGLCIGGVRGCSICGKRGIGRQSKTLGKPVHWGHRQWLPPGHVFRGQLYADRFDGQVEEGTAPPRQTPEDIFEGARKKELYRLAGGVHLHKKDPYKVHGVFRRSILFNLPYWEHLPVRHCVDLMHLIKNVCESTVGFLLGNKDTVKVRADLKQRQIREHLWLQSREAKGGKSHFKPKAPYVLSKKEKLIFLQRLKSVKAPSGYSSYWEHNVDYIVEKSKFGLRKVKSHDYYILMTQLLPACLRGLLDDDVREAIISLSRVFRNLCTKVFDPAKYTELWDDCIITLCKLEMHFPPAFFDVMIHLLLHAVEELSLCGPVHTRWMYWGERIMGHYTNYVSTRANPEASIVNRYIEEEALGFYTEYMSGYTGYRRRVWDAQEENWVSGEILQGAKEEYRLSDEEAHVIHEYVLKNVDVFAPFRREYETWLQGQPSGKELVTFGEWIPTAIDDHFQKCPDADWDLFLLSRPPNVLAFSYKHMSAFGNHFRVMDVDYEALHSYDSGIGGYFPYSPTNDPNDSTIVHYVGELTQILQVNYGDLKHPVILLKARWVRPENPYRFPSFKTDADGFKFANFKQLVKTMDEPYVFPSLVHQLFFLHEKAPSGWRLILRKEPRDCRIFHEPSMVLEDHEPSMINDIPNPIRSPDPEEEIEVSAKDLSLAGVQLSPQRKRPVVKRQSKRERAVKSGRKKRRMVDRVVE